MARIQMFGVAAATSLAGFLTTFTLLQLRVHAMWLRYGLAVLVAYGVFLLLIHRCMQHYQGRPDRLLVLRREGRESGGGWRHALHALDALDLFDVIGEAGLGGILVAMLITIVSVALIYVVASTAVLIPEWIAELVLEGAIGATAYRQIQASTVRETAGPFICLFVLFVAAGFLGQAYAPEAASIGGVIRHVVP
jgi:hypothetical protein